ncbi:MAG: hypothetical protein HY762_06010, partial [Planctomycetes bacterium]|nr:hypothetical protein [Planctomycetota bacterium]
TIELWFYPSTPKVPTNQTILEKIGEDSIVLRNDNSITTRMGSLAVNTQPDVIPFDRWSHLLLTLERSARDPDFIGALTLAVNHKTMATTAGNCILKISKSNLTLGARGSSADMIVDELKVGLVVETERVKIHPDDTVITFASSVATTSSARPAQPVYIQFDEEGRLVGNPPPIKFSSQSANDSFIVTVKR